MIKILPQLFSAIVGFSAMATPASACVVESMRSLEERTDVIVEGAFVLDSEKLGRGHIISKKVLKGKKRRTYEVRWDPHPEDTFQPHELDCVVTVTEPGFFGRFNLIRRDKYYEIIGRWQLVKKGS